MSGLAILGTGSTHGGQMITASALYTKVQSTLAVCQMGDTLDCPIHGQNPIVSGGSTRITAGGVSLAIQGSVAQCGAILNTGFALRVSVI